MLVALAEFIYSMLKINPFLKMILHYTLLLGAFLIVFLAGSGYVKKAGVAGVFIVIIIYTLIYFVFLGIIKLVRLTVSAADKSLDKRTAKRANSKKSKSTKKSDNYTPRFNK